MNGGYQYQLAEERLKLVSSGAEAIGAYARWQIWTTENQGWWRIFKVMSPAIRRADGTLSAAAYRSIIEGIASDWGFPLWDLMIIARCEAEFRRSLLVLRGKSPFDPKRWDAEDAEGGW